MSRPQPGVTARRLARVDALDSRVGPALRASGPASQVARPLGTFGEHAGGWLAVAALGAACDPAGRGAWLRAGTTVLAAHGTAVVLKRLVRRPRPAGDGTARLYSGHSFPSAHATSAAAAAVALGPLAPRGTVAALAAAVAWSRLALGVHHPTDVLAGGLLGSSLALSARRLSRSRT